MSRFDGWEKPDARISESGDLFLDWEGLVSTREETDGRILDWSNQVVDAELAGDLVWFSGALGREVSRPLALCVVHFYNHQTHHRGQVHAMLTSAGAMPDDTDLFAMPEYQSTRE